MKDDLRSLMLGDDAETSAPARAPVSTKIPADVQAARDQGRIAILQEEIRKRQPLADQGNPQAIADIQALQREISGTTRGISTAQAAPQPAPQAAPSGDNLRSLMLGDETPSQSPVSTAGGGRGSYAGYNPSQEMMGKTRVNPMAEIQQKVNQSTSALGGLGEAGLGLISGAVAPFVAAPIGVLKTLGSGKYGTPEGIQAGQNTAAKVQQALTYQPKTEQGQEILGKVGKLMEESRIPPSMIPEVAGFAPLASAAESQLRSQFAQKTQPQTRIAQTLEATRKATPTVGPELTRNIDQLQQQFEQQKAARQNKPTAETIAAPTNEPAAQVDLGTAKPTTPDAPFTELNYSEKGLPLDEQYARAKVLQKVLGEDHAVDMAAIEGKGKERATNFDVSRTDTPQGNLLAEKIADEQRRLNNYGESLIKKSGGTLGLDEATSYKRGNTLLAPFEEYGNHLDDQISKLYAERDKTAKEIPVKTNFTKDLLDDQSVTQLGDNDKLAKATNAKMVKLGMIDKDGNLLDTNAHTAEQLRKWLNSPNVWSPQNAGLHRLLKESIDNDVFAHADQAIYNDARALHGLKKDTLDNPNGIANILDQSGPNGINRKVDVEKVASKIAGLGVDQFTHVIDTLDKMPPQMQAKAQKAKAEIKAQFLNQAINQKTPSKLTIYLEDNKEVMNRLFTPEEMADIRDYHNAAHILKTDVGYKGAAVQKINVEQKLMGKVGEQFAKKGAAAAAEFATGGAGMGVPAVVAHELVGKQFEKSQAKKIAQAEAEAFKKTQERFVPIRDLLKLK
jgi:hypothetical protein